MFRVVQIRLREAGKISYYEITESLESLGVGDYVIVEQERGLEYGQVMSEPEVLLESELQEPLKKITRVATKQDLEQIKKNKERIKDAIASCSKKITQHKLDMKLVEAEYSFDRSKIIFYFTAEERIDFRELVKDLAKDFKARIEMKQIGVRDEARMVGGFGPCGRQLCCVRFLKDFEPVTIRMAKEQNLPLNPSKISGVCGRLMCCLSYEYKTYKELLEGLPKEGQTIKTKDGPGKVMSVNALTRSVTVELQDSRQIQIKYPK